MSIEAKPLVSAIITTFNRSQELKRAVKSVVEQTYDNIEIIIVDDCSDDDTQQVAESLCLEYKNKRPIHYFRQAQRKGACAARNLGISFAKGVFVAGLDDDDAWVKDRIKIFVKEFEHQYAFLTSINTRMYTKIASIQNIEIKKTVVATDDMKFKNLIGNQIFVLKERILNTGGFDEKLEAAQDYDMWLRLMVKFGSACKLLIPLQRVGTDSKNRITTSSKQFSGYLMFYMKHRHIFSRKQRKSQLFRLYEARLKRMSFRTFVIIINTKNYYRMIRHFIMTSNLKKMVKKHYTYIMKINRLKIDD